MYTYKAELLRVIDGDTFDALIDLGMSVFTKKRIRLHGLDTWESRTKNKAEKKKGLIAKERTKELLLINDGKFILKSLGLGKYGRVLGVIELSGYVRSLNQILLDEGHAYVYEGGKKKTFK